MVSEQTFNKRQCSSHSSKTLIKEEGIIRKIKKPVRAISGIIVVAVMTKPYPCPHGRCIYCPGGTYLGTPRSYVRRSPAVMRAMLYDYDPYNQVRARLNQYIAMGHKPSKIEIIVMGGTFPAMPLDYQEWFITQIFDALNRYPKPKRKKWISLEKAIKKNEKAKIRCIGLTIETRPDWSKERHIDRFLKFAATRVELGVQTVFDDILEKIKRGHTVRDTIEATRLLKDAGYKIVYHMMPGLPGSDVKRDFKAFQIIFEDPNFKPDMIKIYPTLVFPNTQLYEMWKRGEYVPYTHEELIELVAKIKTIVPPYVRIMRIQRDVPISEIVAGLKIGNFRQVVQEYMRKHRLKCRCIRCREIGHYILKKRKIPPFEDARLTITRYEASEGIEVFLAYEDTVRDIIYGFLRLRIPSPKAHRKEIDNKSAIVRELHVYGPQIPVGVKHEKYWQHKGIGRKLLKVAERIALEEYDKCKMFIISGVGVREYYRKLGYRKYPSSFYMYKRLK